MNLRKTFFSLPIGLLALVWLSAEQTSCLATSAFASASTSDSSNDKIQDFAPVFKEAKDESVALVDQKEAPKLLSPSSKLKQSASTSTLVAVSTNPEKTDNVDIEEEPLYRPASTRLKKPQHAARVDTERRGLYGRRRSEEPEMSVEDDVEKGLADERDDVGYRSRRPQMSPFPSNFGFDMTQGPMMSIRSMFEDTMSRLENLDQSRGGNGASARSVSYGNGDSYYESSVSENGRTRGVRSETRDGRTKIRYYPEEEYDE